MRIADDPRLGSGPNLYQRLTDYLRSIAVQLNGVTEGRMSALHTSLTAAPTTGTWAQGDFIRNSTPAEAGGVGSKYVVLGWICTAGGTPGTWLQCRVLTGN